MPWLRCCALAAFLCLGCIDSTHCCRYIWTKRPEVPRFNGTLANPERHPWWRSLDPGAGGLSSKWQYRLRRYIFLPGCLDSQPGRGPWAKHFWNLPRAWALFWLHVRDQQVLFTLFCMLILMPRKEQVKCTNHHQPTSRPRPTGLQGLLRGIAIQSSRMSAGCSSQGLPSIARWPYHTLIRGPQILSHLQTSTQHDSDLFAFIT